MIGRTLSHYKILKEISRGGMGIVYKALDLKLNREIAFKVLRPDLVSDPDRKRRFVREAQAAAALQHPSIAVVYEIDEAEAETFIAMELIAGEKLSDELERGPLSASRALDLTIEVAEGLAKAHEKGIVHRDLKPDNIMVTADGHAKIIDFGIAKLLEPVGAGDSESETAIRQETEIGALLGTASYMSPEQARAWKVDNRSDLFSLGIVLHEALTGEHPFKAPSVPEVQHAIIHDDAPRLVDSADGRNCPAELQGVLDRCLAKDREARHPTAQALVADLQAARHGDARGSGDRRSAVSRVVSWTATAAVFGLIAFLMFRPSDSQVPRLENPLQISSALGVEEYPRYSPDGRTLAFAAGQNVTPMEGDWDIWIRPAGSGQPLNRTKDHDGADRSPSWSPDGETLAFWSDRKGGGIFLMSALAGQPRKVADALYANAAVWSKDGSRLAYIAQDDTQLFIEVQSLVSEASRRIALPPTIYAYDPAWSPDERLFAFVGTRARTSQVSVLWVVRVADGEAISLTDGLSVVWSPQWTPDGRGLYYASNRGGSMDLWLQPVDSDGAASGALHRLTNGLEINSFSLSPDGTKLAYSKGRRVANLWRVRILADSSATWDDAEQLTFSQAFIEFVSVSPDGRSLVASWDRAGNPDLWKLPADGGEAQQLTSHPTPDWHATWSPDGKQIAFYAYRSGDRDIWVMPSDGGVARNITMNPERDAYPTWSRDGTQIAFASFRSGNADIWIVAAEGGQLRQLTTQSHDDDAPQWSPDGEWILFQSLRPDRELWLVRPDGTGEKRLSSRPASFARWSPDGEKVYYIDQAEEANIWVVNADGSDQRPATNLEGRPGNLSDWALDTDGEYLYFSWEESVGDIWVMDVVQD